MYVRRSPGYVPQTAVTISGEVIFPGSYVLTHKEERLTDLIAKAGGLNNWAYVKGARLVRQMNAEAAKDSINVANIDMSSSYTVGIDLQAAIANPGSDADLILRAGDNLIIPEYISTVKISGNVMYPNTVTYNDDMTVSDYVTQAGGYGFRSKKSKAYVVYMNGTVAKARKLSKNVVEPGCEIVIPQKREKKANLANILGISTTAASLATMIATIGTLTR